MSRIHWNTDIGQACTDSGSVRGPLAKVTCDVCIDSVIGLGKKAARLRAFQDSLLQAALKPPVHPSKDEQRLMKAKPTGKLTKFMKVTADGDGRVSLAIPEIADVIAQATPRDLADLLGSEVPITVKGPPPGLDPEYVVQTATALTNPDSTTRRRMENGDTYIDFKKPDYTDSEAMSKYSDRRVKLATAPAPETPTT